MTERIRSTGEELEAAGMATRPDPAFLLTCTAEQLAARKAAIDCPHCGKVLRIVVVTGPFSGVNPWDRQPDEHFLIVLEDGYGARLWRREPPK